jgi:ribonuclease BN (tRNA processing enzyme)
MRAWILGSGGWMPSEGRETTCVLIRDGDRALVLDAGTGARRLVTERGLLNGVEHVHVVLTHFHLDHVCGLLYLPALAARVSIWAPGAWLYGTESGAILGTLLRPPVSPDDLAAVLAVDELRPGAQLIGGFEVRASEQPHHWAPTAGIRVGDELALLTDTPYEPSSAWIADGVAHLLHEAWSSSAAARYPERDATAADAGRVAREGNVGNLTLVHLNPTLDDLSPLVEDASAHFGRVALGQDRAALL